jgi:hypothetical protein
MLKQQKHNLYHNSVIYRNQGLTIMFPSTVLACRPMRVLSFLFALSNLFEPSPTSGLRMAQRLVASSAFQLMHDSTQ